ncbi:hypothetical protein R5W23_000820 [Gemmata sp. JC673]|uniref:AB hydrolase-1 domain-containing protein n=1 Tax=Gemmata algarum TaxID=2975278 RepID=A0ABU5ES81_9BACT|nr:hypothetical protein [Gemmata algarum]MDY3558099.1 hypothetical protein [Gemmata algarum]
MVRVVTTLTAAIALATPVAAQPEPNALLAQRYELGQRVKRFEREWEKQDGTAARARALGHLSKLTQQFFAFQFGEAGRSLDLATFALTTDDEPSNAQLWAWSLYAVPESRVLDGTAKELTVTIAPLYALKGERPKNLEVQLWFTDKQLVTARPDKFPHTVKVPLPALGEFEGLDRKLYFMVESGKELRRSAVGVSQVASAAPRLAALKNAAGAWKSLDTIEQVTVRDRTEQLTSVASGALPETDLPIADLLKNAESMLNGEPFFTPAKAGEFWLSVPLGEKKSAPCRVFVPRGLAPHKPVPVVFALHGAGGSENLFFEGYGAGHIVTECRDRGWVLVAPHSGTAFTGAPPVAKILDQLATRYPLDTKRTFVVGHSMGAAQTVELVQKHPGRFAAVAALGGGGSVKDAKPFAEQPTFVGVGNKDFALAAARGLRKALTDGGAKHVTYKEYAGVEHMVIVRTALPDVFALFDERAK